MLIKLNDRYFENPDAASRYLVVHGGEPVRVSICGSTALRIDGSNIQYFDADALSDTKCFSSVLLVYTSAKMFDAADFVLSGLCRDIDMDMSTCDHLVIDSAVKLLAQHKNITTLHVGKLTDDQCMSIAAVCDSVTTLTMFEYKTAIITQNIKTLIIHYSVDVNDASLFAHIASSSITKLVIMLRYGRDYSCIRDFTNMILSSKIKSLTLDTTCFDGTILHDKIVDMCCEIASKVNTLNVRCLTVNIDDLLKLLSTRLVSFSAYLYDDACSDDDNEIKRITDVLYYNTTLIKFGNLSEVSIKIDFILERNKRLQSHCVHAHIVDIVVAMNNVVDEPYILLEIILWTQPGYELLSRKFFVDIILRVLSSIRLIR